MPEPSESQLIAKLVEKTQQNHVDWQTTGLAGQLTASFADKYTLLLSRATLGQLITLRVKNADGDELSSLTSMDDGRLIALFQLASDYARKQIDDQLADLIKAIDKPMVGSKT
jgi:hypothetical protein